MDIPQSLLKAFPPSRDRLLDLVRRSIDDDMLRDIARADYGFDAEASFADLKTIRDHGLIPAGIEGRLVEVLALTRWCDPEKGEPQPFAPGSFNLRGHRTRLFACILLLITARDPSDDSTLAQSLAGTLVLGEEMSRALGCFITWRVQHPEPDSDGSHWSLGLLVLALRLKPGERTEALLEVAAAWVLAEETRTNPVPFDPADPRPRWFSVQHGLWRRLNEELRDSTTKIQSDGLRTNLQLCALLIDE